MVVKELETQHHTGRVEPVTHTSSGDTHCYIVKLKRSIDCVSIDTVWTHTHTHTQNSHSTRLIKDVSMYVHHEVSSCRVLHDKTNMFWCLETCKQVDQEGMVRPVHGLKDPLLTHQTGDRQRGGDGDADETGSLQNVNELCSRDRRSEVTECPHLSTSSRATMSPFFRALMA